MSAESLYKDSIKYLHLISTDTGNPLYAQPEPIYLVSLTMNSNTGFEILALYNGPAVAANDLVSSFLVHNWSPGSTIVFNLPLDRGFTIVRAVASNDLTIAYRGPVIVV